jgi:hypothetical protein
LDRQPLCHLLVSTFSLRKTTQRYNPIGFLIPDRPPVYHQVLRIQPCEDQSVFATLLRVASFDDSSELPPRKGDLDQDIIKSNQSTHISLVETVGNFYLLESSVGNDSDFGFGMQPHQIGYGPGSPFNAEPFNLTK